MSLELHPAVVLAVTPPYVQVQLLDTNTTLSNVPPFTLFGLTTGYFAGLAVGDRVIVTHWAGLPMVLCGLSAWSAAKAALIPSLGSHEQAIYGPTGQVLKMVTAGDIDITINASQKVKLTVGALGTLTIGESSADNTQIGVNGPNGQYVQLNATNADMVVNTPTGHVYVGAAPYAAAARAGDPVSVSLVSGSGSITGGSSKVSIGS